MTRPINVIHIDAARGGHGAKALGRQLGALARRFLMALDLDGCELSLVLLRDPQIRVLKRTWFGIDEVTDVLSFPAGDSPAPGHRVLGDIVVSLDTARRVARERESTTQRELALYLAHGLLHLLGFDHATGREAAKMMEAEARLLRGEGMLARARRSDPPAPGTSRTRRAPTTRDSLR